MDESTTTKTKLLHGDADRDIFSLSFLRKYITYVKHRVRPVLTDETSRFLVEAYATLRSKEDSKTLPVTARTLETMIRLSEAHAKCRLSNAVTVDDARAAIDVMNYALYHEATPHTAATTTAATAELAAVASNDAHDDADDDYDDVPESDVLFGDGDAGTGTDGVDAASAGRKRAVGALDASAAAGAEKQRRTELMAEDDDADADDLAPGEVYVSEARRAAFQRLLVAHMDVTQESSASLADVLRAVNDARRAARELLFTEAEARFILTAFDRDGTIMFADDMVYLV